MPKYVLFLVAFFAGIQFSQAAEKNSRESLRLSLPEYKWAIQVDFKNFKMDRLNILPDYKGQKMQASNPATHMILSAALLPAKEKLTATEYRDWAFERLKKAPLIMTDVKKYSQGSFAFTEYSIKDIEGIKKVNQKNVYLYLVKDDIWIDIHISKAGFNESDQKRFQDTIASIRLIYNYSPSSYDHFLFGSHFYRQKDYKKAIRYYERGFQQEDWKRELPEELWLVLVDNLGMAYGISGDLKAAKGVYEYGLKKRPEFPSFYYSLACTYAEGGDPDHAIINLQKAFQYKENRIKGEPMPDPAKDPSFAKYLNDKKFQDFLQTIKK